MKRILALMTICFLSGCWIPQHLHQSDGIKLEQAGKVTVNDKGYQLRLWFTVISEEEFPETIQTIRFINAGFQANESHRQPMWIPDYQKLELLSSGPYHQRRINTVNPGKTKDAPWCTLPGLFKGVCLIDGWISEDGEILANKTYFSWGGKMGGKIVEERHDLGITYITDFWTSDHQDNPRPGKATLRLEIPETEIEIFWSE